MRDGLHIIVIADDITGAAEMAGMAHSRGLRVQLVCDLCVCGVAPADVLVIATDTRSMTEDEAVAETLRVASSLSAVVARDSSVLIFKKTDSALRGHVVAELKTLMAATGCRSAVYMPANPSKGRVIKGGVYYIKEGRGAAELVPLHMTAFSYDPEFPAFTSSLRDRFPDVADGIIMPDAESANDIRAIVARYADEGTLFAGAADLFRELLPAGRCDSCDSSALSNGPEEALILCGSTQSKPEALGLTESAMPLAVYDGGDDLQPWLDDAMSKHKAGGSLVLTIPHTHRTGRTAAIHLRKMMAEMTRQLFRVLSCPTDCAILAPPFRHLIIEGGATAWATLHALGWSSFDVVRELAPGVVRMCATNGIMVTLKPGSYPWANTINFG